ncbi:MAG: antibiotic biosynthesis monooxygenase [Bacteroidia bacterium]|nr:antibiotic biosynthesis monooxygenase [Bacteroidia bacterium]
MITRIVRLCFKKECVAHFLKEFHSSKEAIASFEGCRELHLMRDADEENIYFTLSKWDSVEALNRYRNSELFKSTWSKVKPFFEASPLAFSLEETS